MAARGAHPARVLAGHHAHPRLREHPARQRRRLGQLPRLHPDLQPPRGRTRAEPDLDARPRTDLLPGDAGHRPGRPPAEGHVGAALPQAGLRARHTGRVRVRMAGVRVQRARHRLPVAGLAAVGHRLVRGRDVPRRAVLHAAGVPGIPRPARDAVRLGATAGALLGLRADPVLVPHAAARRPARPRTVDRLGVDDPSRPRDDDRLLPDAPADARQWWGHRQGDGQPHRQVLRRHLLRGVPVAPGDAGADHAGAAPAAVPGALHRDVRVGGRVGDRDRDAVVLLLRTPAVAPVLAPGLHRQARRVQESRIQQRRDEQQHASHRQHLDARRTGDR